MHRVKLFLRQIAKLVDFELVALRRVFVNIIDELRISAEHEASIHFFRAVPVFLSVFRLEFVELLMRSPIGEESRLGTQKPAHTGETGQQPQTFHTHVSDFYR